MPVPQRLAQVAPSSGADAPALHAVFSKEDESVTQPCASAPGPGWHDALAHSFEPLQRSLFGSWKQVPPSQESSVHAAPSLQSSGVPVHVPLAQ